MTTVSRLRDLQLLDSRISYLEGVLASLDDGSALRTQVDQARADEESGRAELHGKQSRVRSLELELQAAAEKAAKVERDLYSGRITNPKELSAMQEDVQALGRQRQRLEDEILTLMEEVEQLLERVRTLEAQRATRERSLDEHLEEYHTSRKTLAADLESVRAQRESLAAEIDADLLRRYDRLRSRKDGVAVVEVVGGICGGCHVAIPEGRVAELVEGDRIYTCEECGRILYAKG